MANELITKAVFESIADSMAKQYLELVSKVGVTGSDSATFAKGASNQLADLTTEVQTNGNLWLAADLGDSALAYTDACKMSAHYTQPIADFIKALERHVQKRGGYKNISAYIADKATRVHPVLRNILSSLEARVTWPLTSDTTTGTVLAGSEVAALGTVAVSAANTCTFTKGATADKTKYGDGLVKAKVSSSTIASTSDITATVIGTDFNGNAVQGNITLTAGAARNDVFSCPSIRFSEVTNVTVTNGVSSDAFSLMFTDDRTPTL